MEEEQKEEQTDTPEDTETTSEDKVEAKAPITRSRRERKKKRKINKKVIVFVLVIILIVAGGFFLLKEPRIEVEPLPESELTEEIEEPTSTPVPVSIDKEDIKIEVLNGTGIAKEASFLTEQLEDLGYTGIEVGNTEEQDYSTTVVTYGNGIQEEVKDELNDKLEELYENVNTKESSLTDFDIQIITGLRKGQTFPTETPVPSPTVEPTASPTPTATPSATPAP